MLIRVADYECKYLSNTADYILPWQRQTLQQDA